MEEAYLHISKFSRLLRGYLKSSREKFITISEEISNLKDYIELQQTRFKNKFDYAIEVGKAVEPSEVKIPTLLIQPFVENAINHGILPMAETGLLKIKFDFSWDQKEVICTVEDDGIGRKQSMASNENNAQKDSYGNLLIKDLVAIFNKYEQMNIEIAYTDKKLPETGTVVVIKIKIPKNA